MGKATILSHLGDGKYSVSLQFNSDFKDKQLASIDTNINSLQDQLADLTPGTLDYNIVSLQITALNKQKASLEAISDEESIQAWCADLTEDLGGIVGTVEVPGEREAINIQPGYDGNGAYDRDRDGILTKIMAQTPEQCYFNVSQLPGWQKWKPTFRYAVITSLSGDICDITLDTTTSTQQGLSINQSDTISNVPIEYMDCNGAAFTEGDVVLVKFSGQVWTSPVVVGFKDNPQPCGGEFLWIFVGANGNNWVILWDIEADVPMAGVTDNGGNPVTFPVLSSEITNWMSSKTPATVSGAMSFGKTESVAWQATENVYGDCSSQSDPGCSGTPECTECSNEVSGSNSVHSARFVDSDGSKSGTQYYLKYTNCKSDLYLILNGGFSGESGIILEIPGRVLNRVKSKTDIPGERGYIRESYETVFTSGYMESSTTDCIGEMKPDDNQTTLYYTRTWKTPFFGDDDLDYFIREWNGGSDSVPQRTKTEVVDEVIQFISEMSEKNLFIFKKHALRTAYSENTTVGTPLEVQSYDNQIDTEITVHLATAAEGSTPKNSIDPFSVTRHEELTAMVQALVNTVKIPSTTAFVDKITTTMYLYER